MSTPATIQIRPSTGLPRCTICALNNFVAFSSDLERNVPVSKLSQTYNVTKDAIYRHSRSGHHTLHLVTTAVTEADDADRMLSIIDRLDLLATRATRAAGAAYEVGDAALGARLSDSATRVLGLLTTKLDPTEGADAVTAIRRVAERARYGNGISQVMFAAATSSPKVAAALADAADQIGMTEIAPRLREVATPAEEDSDPLEISA